MKVSIRFRTVTLAIAMLIIVGTCFIGCDGSGANSNIAVRVQIRDVAGDPFLFSDAEFTVAPGTTALDAVTKLCDSRGATYQTNTVGNFISFTLEGVTIEETRGEPKDDGSIDVAYISWKYNGIDMGTANLADTVLNEGDVVAIGFTVENVKP